MLRLTDLVVAAAVFTISVAVLNWGAGSVSRRTRGITSLILATFVQ